MKGNISKHKHGYKCRLGIQPSPFQNCFYPHGYHGDSRMSSKVRYFIKSPLTPLYQRGELHIPLSEGRIRGASVSSPLGKGNSGGFIGLKAKTALPPCARNSYYEKAEIIVYLVSILALLLLFSGCAKRVSAYPSPSSAKTAHPPSASSRSVPATQRPYEIFGEVYYPIPSADGFVEEGFASWYGPNFHCKATACGEVYDMYDMTAAHKVLPMHTYLRVVNLENSQETVVRVNDRGPFVKGRILDLSLSAAKALGMYLNGTAFVRIEALGMPTEVVENGQKVKRFVQANYKLGDFWVQVGAFADRNNAERLRSDLKKSYDKVEIELYNREDKLLYRVQVFASNNLDQAREKEQLFSSRFAGAFLVAK